LKLFDLADFDLPVSRCNELENPIGIETGKVKNNNLLISIRCNELENPIGIETGSS